jgi:ABC-type uncharacterized transport system involved in gliding motility auxiliary subunit
MEKRKKENYLIVLLSSLIMIFLIYIGTTWGKRLKWDLTEENLYGLSDGSINVVKKLNSPLRIKFYYSKTAANKGTEGIRAFNNYFTYVKDLLNEYVAHSRNNLTLEVIDPRPDTKDEQDAITYGLKKFQLSETEKYFFGMVVENDSGTQKIIEFFDPGEKDKLEYDITKTIYSVARPAKKKIGILSSLPLQSDLNPYLAQMMRMQGKNPPESWAITELLAEFYSVERVDPGADEIKGVDVLLVVHPKEFSEKIKWAIDQYVLRGGSLLLLVDPMAVIDRPQNPYGAGAGFARSSNLPVLMENWGVKLEEGVFVGDKHLAALGRVTPQAPPSKMLQIMGCDERCSDPYKDITTTGLTDLVFLLPGNLKILEKKDSKAQPILGTTKKGNTFKASDMELNDPITLWNNFSEGSGNIMGVKIFGKFKSAFPEGITVERMGEKKGDKNISEKLTGLTESERETSIIVISDVDFIHNQFAFKETLFGMALANDNSSLFLNSVENLSGSKDLLSIRSKGAKKRNFKVIDEIELEADKETAETVARINASINEAQVELDKLSERVNEGNLNVIKSEALTKKRELDKRLALYKGQLREVKRQGREKIEGIGLFLQYLNTLLIPFLLIIGGLIYNSIRRRRIAQAI